MIAVEFGKTKCLRKLIDRNSLTFFRERSIEVIVSYLRNEVKQRRAGERSHSKADEGCHQTVVKPHADQWQEECSND